MTSRLDMSRRDRRTLVVGLCAVASLITLARGVPALRSWETDRRSEARAAGEQVATLRGGLRTLAALRDSLGARKHRLAALDSSLLFGASPPAIAAELASTVEDLADDNAIKVTAMQLRADSVATSGLARVDVRITGITDISGLAAFLHAVEEDAMPLVVRALSVSQPDPTASDAKPEALRVDVLIASIGTIKTVGREVRR